MTSPEEQSGTLHAAAANDAEFRPPGDAAHSGQGSLFSKTQGGADTCPGLLDVAPSGLKSSKAAALFSGALLLGALLVAGYFFFVGTSGGQCWDNQGYAGRQVAGADVRVFDTDILQEVTKRSLLVAFAAIFLLSLAFRCPFAGAVAVLAAGGAVFGAEFFKHTLPRAMLSPALCPVPGYFSSDTYPSGHTTIGTSLALAIVMVSGPRLRAWTAVAAGFMATSYATAVLFIGWHRPSDALGGIAWSGFCFAAAAGLLVLISGHNSLEEHVSKATWLSGALGLASIIGLFVLPFSQPGSARIPFLSMTACIIAAGFVVPAWFAFELRGIFWRSHHRH